jgi:hypothetical protein
MNKNAEAPTQRSSARQPAESTIWLRCHRLGAAPTANLANGLLDLSESGLQVLAREPLQAGDLIEIVLGSSATGAPVSRRGEVRWIEPVGGEACCAGIRFTEPLSAVEFAALMQAPAVPLVEERFVFDQP